MNLNQFQISVPTTAVKRDTNMHAHRQKKAEKEEWPSKSVMSYRLLKLNIQSGLKDFLYA